ncbi:MAG: hypothetical protein A4E55_01935 [Pelotomaculum sp. PtaU1.Bin035]|nr:MAG: hypothetical protein A4E55_01935 [Pelotomaculum sp. PtaU1.Bin035]
MSLHSGPYTGVRPRFEDALDAHWLVEPSNQLSQSYVFECLDLTVVDFNYRQINLQDIAGRELLYRGPVGLLPLAPLMRQEEPPEVVLDKCAKRLKSEVEAEDERSILYIALAALSSLRFPKELILKALEVSKLENLPFFDGIREEWETKGEIKGRLGMLFDLIETKFGRVPDDLQIRLTSIKEQETIKQVMRKAMSAETLEEFIAKLEN